MITVPSTLGVNPAGRDLILEKKTKYCQLNQHLEGNLQGCGLGYCTSVPIFRVERVCHDAFQLPQDVVYKDKNLEQHFHVLWFSPSAEPELWSPYDFKMNNRFIILGHGSRDLNTPNQSRSLINVCKLNRVCCSVELPVEPNLWPYLLPHLTLEKDSPSKRQCLGSMDSDF